MGMGRSGRRLVAVLAITGLGLALTACGDDDDDTPAAAAEDGGDNTDNNDADTNDADTNDADTNDNDNGDAAADEDTGDNGDDADANADAEDDGDGDDDTIKVDDLKDIPDECLDIFSDFLKQIEPVVEDVDWENADVSSMEGIGEQLDSVASGMDEEMTAAGCDKYELSDENNMDTLIDLAKDEAPGTVAYFEFIKKLSEGFNQTTTPPADDGDDNGGDGGDDAADLPTDCEGARDYIEGLMDKYDTMMDMPVTELSSIGTVTGTLTSACSANELQEFYSDPDVQAFMSAG